jgi:hypothetical protein
MLEVNQWWHGFKYPPEESDWPLHIEPKFGKELVGDVISRLKKIPQMEGEQPSIRQEEYDALRRGDAAPSDLYFQTLSRDLTNGTREFVEELIAVPGLREVRALKGFSRIEAPEIDPTMELFGDVEIIDVETVPLSAKKLDWLPPS